MLVVTESVGPTDPTLDENRGNILDDKIEDE
jgi:hypothetical protein